MEEMKDKITLVIIGRSGSGKGTQANLLIQKLASFGVEHLETGHFLRESLKVENPTTILAREVMKVGGIFPWWYPAYTWLKNLIEKGVAAHHIIFDGSPRKVREAELLDEVIGWHGRPLPLGLYIDVSEEEGRKRLLLRGRADDNPEAIKNRLAFFEPDVLPVIKYFEAQGRLVTVNGEQSVEAAQEEILAKLKEKLVDLWPLG